MILITKLMDRFVVDSNSEVNESVIFMLPVFIKLLEVSV